MFQLDWITMGMLDYFHINSVDFFDTVDWKNVPSSLLLWPYMDKMHVSDYYSNEIYCDFIATLLLLSKICVLW